MGCGEVFEKGLGSPIVHVEGNIPSVDDEAGGMRVIVQAIASILEGCALKGDSPAIIVEGAAKKEVGCGLNTLKPPEAP